MAKKSDYTLPLLGAGALVGAYFLFFKKDGETSGARRGGLRGRAERQAAVDTDTHSGSNAT